MSQVVVVAGGLGTRMLPLTRDVPKVLLEVAGRPFLSHLLDRLEACGFDDVVLAVGHLADRIAPVAHDEARSRKLTLTISEDGPTLLGTGGALRAALPLLQPTFLVTYGDSYLPFDYRGPLAMLRDQPSALAAMAVFANADAIEPSNVAVAGGHVIRYDKERAPGEPRLDHIDYGASALRRTHIEGLPAGTAISLASVLSELAAAGQLLAFPVSERFYEIGSPSGLAALEHHLTSRTGAP